MIRRSADLDANTVDSCEARREPALRSVGLVADHPALLKQPVEAHAVAAQQLRGQA